MSVAEDYQVIEDKFMLTPITDNFHRLNDIVSRNIADCNIQDRTSADYIIASITLHYSQGNVGVWVDNPDDPHMLLVVSVGRFGTMNEVYCFVNSIYIDKEHRDSNKVKQMLDTVELFAQSKQCDAIYGSSWIYRGSLDIASVWKSFGAELQETIYVKHL